MGVIGNQSQLEMSRNLNWPHLSTVEKDFLYHLGLDSTQLSQFSKVKVVCLAGSAHRAECFAKRLKVLYSDVSPLEPIGKTERCSLFLVGDVISMSHGMGIPSCLIFLHEIVKLLHFAKVDLATVDFVRLGTSGGINTSPGNVIITEEGVDDMLQPGFLHATCGKQIRFESKACKELNDELLKHGGSTTFLGRTLSSDDFYEGQARLDGAVQPWYSNAEKLEFLQKAANMGVKNIEMEATGFLAFFQRLGLRATVVCVALLNRLHGDQIGASKEELDQLSAAPQELMLRYLACRFGLPKVA